MLITLPIPLGIGTIITNKRSEISTTCQQHAYQREYDTHWVQNAPKHIVHLGLGFRWNIDAKETKDY